MTDHDDQKYAEFRAAMKGTSARKVRELAASEGIELLPGCNDRDMLVFDLYEKRKTVGTPAASPSPSATGTQPAAGEPAPVAVPDELQETLRAQAVQPVVKVRCRTQKTRIRAGHTFTMKAQEFALGHFSAEEWAKIEADKELAVKWPTPR